MTRRHHPRHQNPPLGETQWRTLKDVEREARKAGSNLGVVYPVKAKKLVDAWDVAEQEQRDTGVEWDAVEYQGKYAVAPTGWLVLVRALNREGITMSQALKIQPQRGEGEVKGGQGIKGAMKVFWREASKMENPEYKPAKQAKLRGHEAFVGKWTSNRAQKGPGTVVKVVKVEAGMVRVEHGDMTALVAAKYLAPVDADTYSTEVGKIQGGKLVFRATNPAHNPGMKSDHYAAGYKAGEKAKVLPKFSGWSSDGIKFEADKLSGNYREKVKADTGSYHEGGQAGTEWYHGFMNAWVRSKPLFAVVPYRGDGRYTRDQAVFTSPSETVARRKVEDVTWTDSLPLGRDGYVVREVGGSESNPFLEGVVTSVIGSAIAFAGLKKYELEEHRGRPLSQEEIAEMANPGSQPHTHFRSLVRKFKARGDVDDPQALAAWIEKKKHGERWPNPMDRKTKSVLTKRLKDLGVYKPYVTSEGDLTEIESYPLEAKIRPRQDSSLGPVHDYRIVDVHTGQTLASGVITMGQDMASTVGRLLKDLHGPAYKEAKQREAEVMKRLTQNPGPGSHSPAASAGIHAGTNYGHAVISKGLSAPTYGTIQNAWYEFSGTHSAQGPQFDEFRRGYAEGYLATVGGRRSNPESSAASMYETFHGRPSTEVLEVEETIHFHENLAALGELVELKVATPTRKDVTINFDSGTQLACNEEGTQLYIIGGDQSLDLSEMGFKGPAADKESVILGVLYELTYHTEKSFHKFKPTDYYHALGEETGDQPTLVYDRVNQLLSVAGGAYEIKDVGITN